MRPTFTERCEPAIRLRAMLNAVSSEAPNGAATGLEPFMLKIEVETNGSTRVIRLIGRIRSEHVDALAVQIAEGTESTALDLREVTLVDLAVVRFLAFCEIKGLELLHCSLYVREWIERERGADGK